MYCRRPSWTPGLKKNMCSIPLCNPLIMIDYATFLNPPNVIPILHGWKGCSISFIYIFVGLILMLWHSDTHITHNGTENHGLCRNRSHYIQTEATLPASIYSARFFVITETAPKHSRIAEPMRHWIKDNPSEMNKCWFQHMCV